MDTKEKRKNYYQNNKEKWVKFNKRRSKVGLHKYQKTYRQKQRLLVIQHYSEGKLECACCGEKTYQFLSIDHINGNGNKDRKITGYGMKFHLWLIRNNFPKGFQILCHNCNLAKGFYGKCPHEL